LLLLLCFARIGVEAQVRDTIRAGELTGTVSDDAMLLDIVEHQSQDIRVRDSIRLEQELQLLTERQARLNEEYQRVSDSIALLRGQSTRIRHQQEDSIRHEMDSLMNIMKQNTTAGEIAITAMQIDNMQDDLEQRAAELAAQRSHWYKELEMMAQFSQNYISPNWYKGGHSSFAVVSFIKARVNYDHDKVSWENLLDWRTGVSTNAEDTLHRYNITDDLLRLYSKAGYKIADQWLVSASADLQTTLWNNFNKNKTTVKSAFMTPLKFNLTAGVDYKPLKDMSLVLSPAVYRIVYAFYGDSAGYMDVTQYGIPAGQHTKHEFGSSILFKWKWQPKRWYRLETEFYFYTNYRGVEIDWEIDNNFVINRFLSARVVLHPRYDNIAVAKDAEQPKLQFKELLTIGFAHTFR